ncbi:hypothetical protein HMPREF3192_00271 [Atopobium deltae]|uniref:Uncharacterized protein n=1 Tax=Atopobium deltae TaxID=1393034 RepID=A0A133XWT4_9ACTN|nr:hypothetical protein HMPREF3192_00271 [Atopobium deltae]
MLYYLTSKVEKRQNAAAAAPLQKNCVAFLEIRNATQSMPTLWDIQAGHLRACAH